MKDLVKRFNFLGGYQVIGAGLSLPILLYHILNNLSIGSIIVVFIILGICAFSFYCGYLLLKGNYDKGLRLSVISQFLQIFSIAIGGYSYSYAAGIGVYTLLDITNDVQFVMDIDFFNFDFSLAGGENTAIVGVNIVAIILMNKIFKWQKKLEEIKKRIADL
ncbi:hypothetical protein GCM10007424_25920 [Flavobacterium suaedae]|uniref:DUF4199 domain-containing protein n=1 Tax=Flavobacterium suaedae TaxID=1767027 RepID=A0ABQ1K521_9FLAO|nr:hypothetical protein [Flavobacterium suaedae]GGB84687.1 hypothetical protein GCM10007424_25920 [Flavobacterium suaedae]